MGALHPLLGRKHKLIHHIQGQAFVVLAGATGHARGNPLSIFLSFSEEIHPVMLTSVSALYPQNEFDDTYRQKSYLQLVSPAFQVSCSCSSFQKGLGPKVKGPFQGSLKHKASASCQPSDTLTYSALLAYFLIISVCK